MSYENTNNRWYSYAAGEAPVGSLKVGLEEIKNNPSTDKSLWYELLETAYGSCTNTSHMVGATNAVPPYYKIQALDDGVLRYNILRAGIDALIARVFSRKPRVRFLTSGGTYKSRRRAQSYTNWIDGLFFEQGTYAKGQRIARAAMVYGQGWMKISSLDDKILHEFVPVNEVYVEDNPAGDIICLYHEQLAIPGSVLLASALKDDLEGEEIDPNKEYDLIEGWYTPKSGEGRYMITLNEIKIADDVWPFDTPPFAKFNWKDSLVGSLGESLIAEFIEIQAEINWLLEKSQQQMNMQCYHVFLDSMSGIKSEKMTNENLSIHYMNTNGKPPFVLPIPGADAQTLQRIEELEAKFYKLLGLGEMWAQGSKPAGVTAAVALRQLDDNQSARYQDREIAYQQFYIDVAQRSIELANHLAESGTKVKVNYDNFGSVGEVGWEPVNLEKEGFVIRAWPVSILPQSPAGQLQTALDIAQSDPSLAVNMLGLLDFPDVQAIVARKLAKQLVIEKCLDSIVVDDEFVEPDPHYDLLYGITQFEDAYNQCVLNEEDESVLQNLRDWIDAANDILESQQSPEPPVDPNALAAAAQGAPPPSGPASPVPQGAVPPMVSNEMPQDLGTM